jgi:photosystem II CP47 chlorophyll apoprotein
MGTVQLQLNWIIWPNTLPMGPRFLPTRNSKKRVQTSLASGSSAAKAWSQIPWKLAFYDYIGNNPAKGVFSVQVHEQWWWYRCRKLVTHLQRSRWSRIHVVCQLSSNFPRLLDKDGVVRADVPFRKAESKYSIEQVGVSVTFTVGTYGLSSQTQLQLKNMLVKHN